MDGQDAHRTGDERSSNPQQCLRDRVAEGFQYTHRRANANTAKTLEAASFLYALIEILEEKGLFSVEELDARKEEVVGRLGKRFAKDGMGVILQDPQPDKYAFDKTAQIGCENRVHLCKASCCRIPFALSKQDLQEGAVRWNLAEPYMIDQDEDGCCTHLDRCSRRCDVYQQRPVPCRGYDCRNDRRIWLDFHNRIPNPAVDRSDWLEFVSRPQAGTEPA
jgi:hypothetical protein